LKILIRKFAVAIITGYQRCLSPFLAPCCRFAPSCSQYAKEAFIKYGIFKGGAMALVRLAKCHPFHSGGFDPIK
jgi:hypothetical protein